MGVYKVFPRVPSNTKLAGEVPITFKEPDIIFGYRENYQPFSYYTQSAMWLHNESLNVWTHGIAFIILAHQTWLLCSTLDLINDGYAQMFLVYCLCSCAYMLGSSLAHLYQSKDELTHHTCFYFDYMGVSLYGPGLGLAHFYFSSDPIFFQYCKNWFMPVNWVLSMLVCLCCSYAKYRFKRPYPKTRKYWQIFSVGLGYAQVVSPVYYVLLHTVLSGGEFTQNLYMHLLQSLLFIPGAIFFAVPYPQKLYPGLFDLVGHSHQLFHIFMALMTYFQMRAVYVDLVQKRDQYAKLFQPSVGLTYGYVLSLIVVDLIIVYILHQKTRVKLEKELSVQKKES